ncbi:MAG TPA: fimbria/pilus outer membrane usher protein [Scandinavium sp.]|jgi:outer membrane usher protein
MIITHQKARYFIKVICVIALHLSSAEDAIADDQNQEYFNPALLELGSPEQVPSDLSAFEREDGQLPGTYHVDIYLNNSLIDTRDVEFKMMPDATGKLHLLPCLSVESLTKWGVITQQYPELGAADATCANMDAIPQASSDFRFSQQQLLLSIPQSAVNSQARGWVDPKRWDDGIPAFLLNYSANGSNNENKTGENTNNQYMNLRPGVNFGPWRLRNYSTWTRSSTGGKNGESTSQWDSVYTYLQRDIKVLKSQLILGDSSSPADVFDSVPFRGVQIASDDDMRPESLRGYAPSVRGIARTNAQVTVRQNGYVIYQTYVSPGAFEINDMYPTGSAGDLYVTIKESDGSEQHLVIPYASLPVLQREGQLKYSLTSGTYRSYDSSVVKTPFAQSTFIYGMKYGFTGYGGGQFSNKYQAMQVGGGKNLGQMGAVSIDMTQSWARQNNGPQLSGRSFRARYSKNFVTTGTNFAIAGYRYATSNFLTLQQAFDSYHEDKDPSPVSQQRRDRAEMTVSQSLGSVAGSVALTAIIEDYWDNSQGMKSYSVSYNNAWNGISYGLSYAYNRNSNQTGFNDTNTHGKIYSSDQLFSFNISIPLDKLFNGKHPVYASYMLNSSKYGTTTNSLNVSGTALEDNNLSWGVQQGYGSNGQGNSGSASADWRAGSGELTGGYGYDKDSQRLNYGIQGGIVAHQYGVTLSQPLGETIALVAAPGAKSVAVQGQNGVKTDWRGYAVVTYVSPYRKNTLSLNTESFADDIEVPLTTQTVIPTRGAVVVASYQASVGHRMLLSLNQSNGKPVPFGAIVSNPESKFDQGFIVGDNGQVYLTGLAEKGKLEVNWGKNAKEQCSVDYRVSNDTDGLELFSAQCI